MARHRQRRDLKQEACAVTVGLSVAKDLIAVCNQHEILRFAQDDKNTRKRMKFGIFDHMDRGGPDLGRQFDERLRLIELYEKAGFHAYHLAEHHATPLGMAPSPSVFLAAVA